MSENESNESNESTQNTEEVVPAAEPDVEVGVEAAAEAEIEAEAGAEAETGVEPAALLEVAGEAAPEALPEARRRRRIKTRTVFVGAVVLGVLGGVGTGYAVQQSRPPTPLPPLSVAEPKYLPVGVYAGVAPSPLPASQDDATVTDGDLTKLLLPTPSGDTTLDAWDHQYIGVVDEGDLCKDPVHCFTDDENNEIRAIADTGWNTPSGYFYEIRIYRFAPGKETGGSSLLDTYTDSLPAPAGVQAVYSFTDSYGAHADYAFAQHGDLAVVCWVSSPTNTPNPSMIDGLITQQMARL